MGYYFISVGGSGARVLESLAHLTVAGLLPNQQRAKTLHVLSVDPDTGNGNLTRTNRLLECIGKFQNIDVGQKTSLLKTKLQINNPSIWEPTSAGDSLDKIITYARHKNTAVGRLYTSLYTEKERTTQLDVGFRGRPSIGAAVIAERAMTTGANVLNSEPAWQNFIDTVTADLGAGGTAHIFLAGSVFGGTGAAGLPTIAKLLRQHFDNNNKGAKNTNLRIGGALLLPYFSFTPTAQFQATGEIFASSDKFLTNTKAALGYYADIGGNSYDSMYFIGDDTIKQLPTFSVGDSSQRNDAHIVDLFAAMAAIHFYGTKNAQHCYCISRNNSQLVQWNDLPDIIEDNGTIVSVRDRLGQFVRFILAYLHIVKPKFLDLEMGRQNIADNPWYRKYLQGKVKCGSDEVQNFENYAVDFVTWLSQVENYADGRTVELINTQVFNIQNRDGKICIDVDHEHFKTLDYSNGNIAVNDVVNYINAGQGGWFSRIFSDGGNNDNGNCGKDFGLFLRRLYDGCARAVKN